MVTLQGGLGGPETQIPYLLLAKLQGQKIPWLESFLAPEQVLPTAAPSPWNPHALAVTFHLGWAVVAPGYVMVSFQVEGGGAGG